MGREKSKKTIRTEVASLRAEGLADGGVMRRCVEAVVVVLSRASGGEAERPFLLQPAALRKQMPDV